MIFDPKKIYSLGKVLKNNLIEFTSTMNDFLILFSLYSWSTKLIHGRSLKLIGNKFSRGLCQYQDRLQNHFRSIFPSQKRQEVPQDVGAFVVTLAQGQGEVIAPWTSYTSKSRSVDTEARPTLIISGH